MHAFVIRQAVASDAEALSELAARTFSDAFGHLFGPGELAPFLTTNYHVSTLLAVLEDPAYYTALLFHRDDPSTPCGYGMLHEGSVRTGDDGPSEDYLELKRFYVDKAFHGSGSAYLLMDAIMTEVKRKARKITWLGVWEHNIRAQKFYHKFGFAETSEDTAYVGSAQKPYTTKLYTYSAQ